MARIRSIHPGLWTDEAFVSVSQAARLLFIGVLNECDDQGAFEWKPVTLKMRLAPADNVDVAALLEELETGKLVRRYAVGGSQFGAVRNFREWQRPKKPNAIHPMPPEFRTYAGPKARGSEPTDANSISSGEPGHAVPPPNAEPDIVKLPTVPNQFPTSGEIPPQMEDGGGEKEEEEPPFRSPQGGKRSKSRTTVSPKWQPDPAGAAFAAERNVDATAEIQRFRDYHAARGSLMADWSAAWRTWCGNAVKFANGRGIQPRAAIATVNGHATPDLLQHDPWGMNAWIAALPDTHLGTLDGEQVACINGLCLTATVEAVCNAAGIGDLERPRLDAIADWCRADLAIGRVVLESIRQQAARTDEPIRSLRLFDALVRSEAPRHAA